MKKDSILLGLYPNGIPPSAYAELDREIAIVERFVNNTSSVIRVPALPPGTIEKLSEVDALPTITVAELLNEKEPSTEPQAQPVIHSVALVSEEQMVDKTARLDATLTKAGTPRKRRPYTRVVHKESLDSIVPEVAQFLRVRDASVADLARAFHRGPDNIRIILEKLRSQGYQVTEIAAKTKRDDHKRYVIRDASAARVRVDSVTVDLIVNHLRSAPCTLHFLMRRLEAGENYIRSAIHTAVNVYGHNIVEDEKLQTFTLHEGKVVRQEPIADDSFAPEGEREAS